MPADVRAWGGDSGESRGEKGDYRLKAQGLRADVSVIDEIRGLLDGETLCLKPVSFEAKVYPYHMLVGTVSFNPIPGVEVRPNGMMLRFQLN